MYLEECRWARGEEGTVCLNNLYYFMTKRKTNGVKNWKPSLMVCKTLNLKAVLGNAEKPRNVSILNNLDSWNGTGKCLPCRRSIRQIEESKCFPLLFDGGFPAASSGLFCKSHQVLRYTACLERMNVGSADQVSTFTPNPSQGRIFITIETIQQQFTYSANMS